MRPRDLLIARNQIIRIMGYDGRKLTHPLNMTHTESVKRMHCASVISKQPGSKIIFMTIDGKQVTLDAYLAQWKRSVIKMLKKESRHTSVVSKKELLESWIDSFKSKSKYEIYDIIKKELKNENSPLLIHDNQFFGLFVSSPTFKSLEGLVKRFDDMMTSTFTFDGVRSPNKNKE